MSYTWVDDAYWQDVLDARYHGPTEAYSQVNGAFGVKWGGEKFVTIKVINLFNEDIQSHVFGDILKRQVIGELRVRSKQESGIRSQEPGARSQACNCE